MTKQWKSTGPEQDLLERMFNEGSIEDWETPVIVQAKDPIFKPFSERVFTNHFRTTKSKMGYSNSNSFDFLDYVNGILQPIIFSVKRMPIDFDHNIPELGGVGLDNQSRSIASNFNEEPLHPITYNQPPCWTWVYTDHEKKLDFVCVAIPALCGKNSKFTISEDGMKITITYDWPEVMMKANELFSKSTANNGRKLSMSHPKVHSFISHLHDSGVTENSKLSAEIAINFPKKVQRENSTWSAEKVVVSDTKMIILEFSAYQKSLIINDTDTSLDF